MRLFLCGLFLISGCEFFGPASVFDDTKPDDSGTIDTGAPCEKQAWYRDSDGDGYGISVSETWACEAPEGFVANGKDCDDDDPAVNPGAVEVCNGIDDNCDGEIDNDPDGDDIWYIDADSDGYGNPDMAQDCDGYEWFVSQADDCNDLDPAVNPAATELCDEVDNDCDSTIDEDDAADATPWYEDADGDLYGNSAVVRDACAKPEGFVADATDCDDTDAGVNPDASEFCDEKDNNCNSEVDEGVTLTFYADLDADLYGDAGNTMEACLLPDGYVEDATDCDDDDPAVNPGAVEDCNGFDDDCNSEVDEGVTLTFYADVDADSYGDSTEMAESCEAPVGYVADATDCNDLTASAYPGADEYCDALDNDCDSVVDESDAIDAGDWFADADGDLYGDVTMALRACTAPMGYVADATDCNDETASAFPGADEYCDALDNDCDSVVDESDAIDAPIWYTDDDLDGYGDAITATFSCTAPAGMVEDGTDCDDLDRSVHPNATEFCDEMDNDCDGLVDEERGNLFFADADGDGFGDPSVSSEACAAPATYVDDATDCDDTDVGVNPGASELCNGLDDDCDGMVDEDATDMSAWYLDYDSDSFGNWLAETWSCDQPAGYVANATDCNDLLPSVSPSASETCNGLDDNCDGSIDEGVKTIFYADADADLYGNVTIYVESCEAPTGYVEDATDCNDDTASAYPGASEYCDTLDNDCDSVVDESDAIDASNWFADADSDGYGNAALTARACTAPSGYIADATDCDDLNRTVNPGASELCNGLDDDCDGTTDEGVKTTFYVDADSDGYGVVTTTTQACSAPTGYVADASDCDDSTASVYPGADELCDGMDNDCDGDVDGSDAIDALIWYLDADADGFGNAAMTARACSVPTGYVADATDCNDLLYSVNPSASESCNGLDDDCDGATDEGVKTTFYADADADGYGNVAVTEEACEPSEGFVYDSTDCDDADVDVNPGADEFCNSLDDNCDGTVDEDDAVDAPTWYADSDLDLYGDENNTLEACTAPAGYIADATDCDDTDDLVNPEGIEICDDTIDNDCDGDTDLSDECLYEGTYLGTFEADVTLTAFGITDTCMGTVELDVAIDGEPMIFGEASCAFLGFFATYYADDIVGEIEGDIFSDMDAEGDLYDDDEIFSSVWAGLFDTDELEATFVGEGALLGYTYTYDGVFDAIYTTP